MNPLDENYPMLEIVMYGLFKKNTAFRAKDLTEVSQKILKNEWGRLKDDLERATE